MHWDWKNIYIYVQESLILTYTLNWNDSINDSLVITN